MLALGAEDTTHAGSGQPWSDAKRKHRGPNLIQGELLSESTWLKTSTGLTRVCLQTNHSGVGAASCRGNERLWFSNRGVKPLLQRAHRLFQIHDLALLERGLVLQQPGLPGK